MEVSNTILFSYLCLCCASKLSSIKDSIMNTTDLILTIIPNTCNIYTAFPNVGPTYQFHNHVL